MSNFNFYDAEFDQHLRDPSHPNHQNIVNFLTHLALCHTIVIQKKKAPAVQAPQDGAQQESDKSSDHSRESYSAQSPDELALVNAARQFGIKFRSRPTARQIMIEIDLPTNMAGGSPASVPRRYLEFELLNIIEFSSARRRMSVIVRDPKGEIKLLTKGADSIIEDLLAEIDPSQSE